LDTITTKSKHQTSCHDVKFKNKNLSFFFPLIFNFLSFLLKNSFIPGGRFEQGTAGTILYVNQFFHPFFLSFVSFNFFQFF
jgi:hypothetical protein